MVLLMTKFSKLILTQVNKLDKKKSKRVEECSKCKSLEMRFDTCTLLIITFNRNIVFSKLVALKTKLQEFSNDI